VRILRGTSVDDLEIGLADRLASCPPADPFAPVDIAVPSRGMERWLVQRLAADLGARDGEAGVCANVRFPFPGSTIRRVLSAVLGDDLPDEDPWSPQRLAWPLLEHLEDLSADPVNAPLHAHLSEGGERAERRRYPLARRIADLFDRYAMYRPEMVRGWTEGGALDAAGEPLLPNMAWQPPLWRALVERLGVPSPDARFRRAIGDLERGRIARPDDLPPEVTVFGVLSLPPLHLELLAALAPTVEVTIHALAPCTSWSPGHPPSEPSNPLLASCGIAAQNAHAAFARHESPWQQGAEPEAGFVTPVDPGDGSSALQVLKADIRHDRRRGQQGDNPVPLRPDDRSVQVHACHGPMRQLEVLREVVYGLLEDDHTLEPRDIVVLTPDITAYDPIISAVFSDGDPPGGRSRPASGASGVPTLPFLVADRTVRDENAVAQALLAVLDLVTARVAASAVVDLLASGPVSARFGLSPTDLAELPSWVLGTGISWGMDGEHRNELIGLDDATHTWKAGLDRLVVGAAMSDDGTRMVGRVVPYDDVEGSDVELLGRLATATDALFHCLRSLRSRRPVAAWQEALENVVERLLDPGAGPQRDARLAWQLTAVREALAGMVLDSRGSDNAPSDVELTLEEVRTILGSHLGQPSGSARYGTGAITFAGLEPLRNVPHRVVCLVGLDDGALPRSGHRHGFDLVAMHPEPGDPDPRVEDRQLLLDAILSAGDHLVITYTGHDPRTNELRQPAVPVSELLDVLSDSLTVDDDAGSDVRSRLVTSHPLQPHSPRYFRPPLEGSGEGVVPRAFDRRQLAAALTAVRDRRPAPDFFPADRPLPSPGGGELDPHLIELGDLIRFLEHPVRHLLQRRVGVMLGEDDRRLEDRDPTELDGLERWKLGQDLLDQHLAGSPRERWRELTLACGTVPVGGIGEVALDGIEELVEKLCEQVERIEGEGASVPVDVLVPLLAGGDRRLVGSVEVVGSTVLHVGVSKLKAKHRIATWTRLLAVIAAQPGLDPVGRLLGQDKNLVAGYRDTTLRPLAATQADGVHDDPAEFARGHLANLVDLYLRGHSQPLPLLPEVACAYSSCREKGEDHEAALARARSAWEGNDRYAGEQGDAYVVQAFGSERDLADLVRSTTFAGDALRIWGPIVEAEVKT
jgi:exodeoxyribonuclease V gamma subunit